MRWRVILLAMLLCMQPISGVAETVDSNTLIEQATAMNGQRILYTGEVIGDILPVGDYEWLNISDGSNAIGVWLPRSLGENVQIAGRYNTQGDIVQIEGLYHRACPEHGGDLDIHADKVTLLKRGEAVVHAVSPWKLWLGGVLFLLAMACMMAIYVGRTRSMWANVRKSGTA